MAANADVNWVRDRPWELKDKLITTLDLPLNLQGNPHNRFHSVLTGVRERCVVQVKALPMPNPASEAGGSGHRCVDSSRDSNSATYPADAAHDGTQNIGARPNDLPRGQN
jgi:GIY-YIG catalytic domain